MDIHSAAEYHAHLRARMHVPEGFRFAVGELTFEPAERPGTTTMRLALIDNDGPLAHAAFVATRNAVAGAPVHLLRLREPDAPLRTIMLNTRVSNVGIGTGVADARAVVQRTAARVGRDPSEVVGLSTGVIGWRLPVEAMGRAIDGLETGSADPVDVASAIMTTDRYPKVASGGGAGWHLLGVAKGAGMIAPNMATMLAVVMTDAIVDPEVLRAVTARVANRTFNRISVDGDESTSDVFLVTANGASGRTVAVEEFEAELERVCSELAWEIVRNGEGTGHVLSVSVEGAASDREALRTARGVANSPLVKTAIAGNDPNVGRIAAAVGAILGADHAVAPALSIRLGDAEVFRDGAFRLDPAIEAQLAAYLRERAFDPDLRGYPQWREAVEIAIDLARGDAPAVRVIGSDLTHAYITENADYRS